MPRQGVSDAHTGPAVLGSLAYRMPWADRVTYSPADREVQRILLELLNQMDGFDQNVNVKVWDSGWAGDTCGVGSRERCRV